jgi:glycosyltransferase involved in cell wall biosynthesis
MLITFQPTSSVLAALVGSVVGCRARVVHQANLPETTHRVPGLLDRWAGTLGLYSVIIMNSAATEQAYASYPTGYRQRLRRIEHGIELAGPSRDRLAVRHAMNIPEQAPVLLTCSRLTEQKSVDTIISALPQVPNAHLVIAGEGPEGEALKRLADRCGVSDRTHFLGFVPNQSVSELYDASDLYVSSSLWETFGLSTVEAATRGLPIVASEIPASLEVLTIDGTTPAVFVKGREADAWSKAIADALGDPELQVRARNFAPIIRAHYSKRKMLIAYRALTSDLLAKSAH